MLNATFYVIFKHCACFWIIESPSKLPQLPCEKKRRWKKSSDERRCRQWCRLSLTFSRNIGAASATRKKVRKLWCYSLPICFYSAVCSSTALNLINNIHMTTGIWKSAAATVGQIWNESFKFSCYSLALDEILEDDDSWNDDASLWFLLHWPN